MCHMIAKTEPTKLGFRDQSIFKKIIISLFNFDLFLLRPPFYCDQVNTCDQLICGQLICDQVDAVKLPAIKLMPDAINLSAIKLMPDAINFSAIKFGA